ncbi:hypothetical protein Ciccas_003440 [Cichlidogyrus casuarinus]|uniref:Protein HGH1 C-terminal domain-containing protein n=1 Tax=Cichlidogyrus casuarinus TaxID=1844966 RepID=A0ABD2QHN2_9PLAT
MVPVNKYHIDLIGNSDLFLDNLLLPLCTEISVIDEEDRSKLSEKLSLALGKQTTKTETQSDILTEILDALFLLCSSASSRNALRLKGTYFVLRDFHNFCIAQQQMDDSAWKRTTTEVEKVVDQLICEEKERPSEFHEKSLRSIAFDPVVVSKLDKINLDLD